MSGIVLHHYPTSPFAEKVRIALGIKGLAWQSVIIPVVMPKPDLMPLTGGYRRTPVMQIGADIYCDTQCILREIERRFPQPSLYLGSDSGTTHALAFGAERSLFSPAVGVALGRRSDMMPAGFLEDRAKFSGREMNLERIRAAAPLLIDQLRAQLRWYETMLADGRPFLLGKHPTLADCAVYHPCWFIGHHLGPTAEPLGELPNIQAWMGRVRAIGHGSPTELSAQDALAIAAAATPQIHAAEDANDPAQRRPGDKVQVLPDDTGRDPVDGEIVALSRDEIVIRRADPQVGEIAVHFPRAGFIVQPVRPHL
jgi:glutathione S-transferase